MTEYVKKSEVLDTLWKADGITYHGIEVLNHMPAEDVVERKTGRWSTERLASTSGSTYMVFRCSNCKAQYPLWPTEYCPHCGAKMEVTDD